MLLHLKFGLKKFEAYIYKINSLNKIVINTPDYI